MTTPEFIREKNRILRGTIGIDFDLTPEDQIKDIPRHLSKPLSIFTSSGNCPYCLYYTDYSKINVCYGCPMERAGNKCNTVGSTWNRYWNFCSDTGIAEHMLPESPAFGAMSKLIAKYNEELV